MLHSASAYSYVLPSRIFVLWHFVLKHSTLANCNHICRRRIVSRDTRSTTMEFDRCVSSVRRGYGEGGLAWRILMPWTCRKDRPAAPMRRHGEGSDALMKHRHRVHPSDNADSVVTARRAFVGGRRVWKNLFPVNGRSILYRINKLIRSL